MFKKLKIKKAPFSLKLLQHLHEIEKSTRTKNVIINLNSIDINIIDDNDHYVYILEKMKDRWVITIINENIKLNTTKRYRESSKSLNYMEILLMLHTKISIKNEVIKNE